ncbi:MAG: hypothetical protein RLP11_20650, partial [Marinoscillum sp.]|uniref:hypothetical protein n=1 Tax=Marinoscillum sp. TaxID=2024838 RepID=UPI0032FDEBEF
MRYLYSITLLICSLSAWTQVDSSLLKKAAKDSTITGMNMDAVYNRPFLQVGKTPIAVGGYIEADYQYMGEDGLTEGHSFRIPRLTIFMSSAIHQKIKFLTELELEEGGKEIAIEFAALDFNFHPLLNLRGGVIMNPIGAFNQNHDGPKWEFVDRPLSAEKMLPATWSNVGFGIYGKHYQNDWAFGYEGYLTNGFNNAIIENDQNRTFLPASKANADRFEETNNGEPLITLKTGLRYKNNEIGLSYMGGIYNTHTEDGLVLENKRRLDVWAVDFNTTLTPTKTYLVGEYAWIWVDVPASNSQQYGNQ